jgi:hypothetical protein
MRRMVRFVVSAAALELVMPWSFQLPPLYPLSGDSGNLSQIHQCG